MVRRGQKGAAYVRDEGRKTDFCSIAGGRLRGHGLCPEPARDRADGAQFDRRLPEKAQRHRDDRHRK